MSILELLAKRAIDIAGKVIVSKFLDQESEAANREILPENLSAHLNYVVNWSASIHFVGLGRAKDTDTESIDLTYYGTARKFRGVASGERVQSEKTLLNIERSHLLIGDPGAGKTTSLKRVARTLFQDSPSNENDEAQYPILIRIKEIDEYTNIYHSLAHVLGFQTSIKEKITIEKKAEPYIDDNGDKQFKIVNREKREPYAAIGETELEKFIINFLNDSRALVLLDGLDEARESILRELVADISKLTLQLSTSKLILTSRTGLYYTLGTIEGMDVLDILPLDADQIEAIASIWTNDPLSFVSALNSSPYKDLSNRPLLLSQLLFIFDRYGELPRNPREIYHLIVELLLKEWDADRNIVRKSKYSGFSPKRKSEFLSELAFNLMYKGDSIRFDSRQLQSIYEEICEKYELPKEEEKDVAREIESHTGIVVSTGHMSYEFSHLSIQEFLCADYIVRSPVTNETTRLLEQRIEPVAIAIALASDSSSWFCNLITDPAAFKALSKSVGSFFKRLVAERPVFRHNDVLGFCIFYLHFHIFKGQNRNLISLFRDFSDLVGIRGSVSDLLYNPKEVTYKPVRKSYTKQVEVIYTMSIHHISHSTHNMSLVVSREELRDFFKKFNYDSDSVIDGLVKDK